MRRRLFVAIAVAALVAGPAAAVAAQTEGTGRTPGTPRQESTQGRTERIPGTGRTAGTPRQESTQGRTEQIPGTGRTPGTPRTGRPSLPATGSQAASLAQDAATLIAAGALMLRLRRRFA